MSGLPPTTVRICNACPWRRESAPGWLGPFDAQTWLDIVNSDVPIACHQTIEVEGEWEGAIRQCAGAAQYRCNTHKSPRDPEVAVADEEDLVTVFGRGTEFLMHHNREAL